MKQWLWGLAERMDWNSRWPRGFWRWLLRRMDEAHGHFLEYDDDEPLPTGGQEL